MSFHGRKFTFCLGVQGDGRHQCDEQTVTHLAWLMVIGDVTRRPSWSLGGISPVDLHKGDNSRGFGCWSGWQTTPCWQSDRHELQRSFLTRGISFCYIFCVWLNCSAAIWWLLTIKIILNIFRNKWKYYSWLLYLIRLNFKLNWGYYNSWYLKIIWTSMVCWCILCC